MKIIFQGTGTSTGVPEIGCNCTVCRSSDLRDKRLRTSLIVEYCEKRFLIECGPDFRQQSLGRKFDKIDAVLLSHEHYDHVGGIDDLRPFCRRGNVPIYCESTLANTIYSRMPYCFSDQRYPGAPRIDLHEIDIDEPFIAAEIKIIPIRVMHGKLPIAGFRIADMAYLTDMSYIPQSEYSKLKNLKVLVISALRPEPHPSHQNVAEALQQIERIGAKNSYLIHMSHDFGLHSIVEKSLPANVHISYDNLDIEF